jgi:hypothetical protein
MQVQADVARVWDPFCRLRLRPGLGGDRHRGPRRGARQAGQVGASVSLSAIACVSLIGCPRTSSGRWRQSRVCASLAVPMLVLGTAVVHETNANQASSWRPNSTRCCCCLPVCLPACLQRVWLWCWHPGGFPAGPHPPGVRLEPAAAGAAARGAGLRLRGGQTPAPCAVNGFLWPPPFNASPEIQRSYISIYRCLPSC